MEIKHLPNKISHKFKNFEVENIQGITEIMQLYV